MSIAPAPASPSKMSDLGPRVASGIVMIIAALGTLWAPEPTYLGLIGSHLFVLFWLGASLAVHWEWQRLIGAERASLRFFVGGLALAGAAGLARSADGGLAVLLIAIAAGIMAWAAGPGKRIWAAGGMVYAGALVISVLTLRLSLFHGLESILWLFAVVWGTDIFAYFGGRLIGGPKLWPRVSPSKTWSGFLCGITAGALLGLLVLYLRFGTGEVRFLPLLGLGLVTAAISQGGDLVESSVKRFYGIKDSSRLIPGHGGFMDRLDGFLFAAAFAAIVGVAHSGLANAAHGLLQW